MHDNTPVYTAAIIQTILAELGVEVMIWPPYSPDMNPIENLWALMKSIIYECYPELEKAPNNRETLEQLVKAAKEAWHAIDDRILKHCCIYMNLCLTRCKQSLLLMNGILNTKCTKY